MPLTLADLGWNAATEKAFQPYSGKRWLPGRLIRDNKITYGALLEGGEELEVVMSGKVYHEAECDADLPAVGDWVAIDPGGHDAEDWPVIRARLPRQTCFSRKAPGRSSEEQVIAANVDLVMVVTDPDTDFNPRRMERYFAIIARSGARPVVIVNKADLHPKAQCEAAAAAIRELNPEAEVLISSAVDRKGVRAIRQLLPRGVTATLVGSSGVGKSSLVNQLLGGGEEWQLTGEVNDYSGKGRHTTTAREVMVLRGGGILIDNPGIREVQMWTDEKTLREQFADLEALAAECRFHDCRHGSDRGCAIRAAVESGALDSARYDGFLRLDDEIARLKQRRKRARMTSERRAKREHRIQARNLADRVELEREKKPNR